MRVFSLIILALFTAACGDGSHDNKPSSGFNADGISNLSKPNPKELMEYYESFLREAENAGRDASALPVITMYFGTINIDGVNESTNTVGICLWDKNHVIIDKGWFLSHDKTMREVLVFHELGHCALGLQHNDSCETFNEDGSCDQVTSIMASIIDLGAKYYDEYRSEYLNQLFNAFK